MVQYRIKGTWYVNKRLGELKYRLLGIAPVAPDVSTLSDGPAAMADALVPLFGFGFRMLVKHSITAKFLIQKILLSQLPSIIC